MRLARRFTLPTLTCLTVVASCALTGTATAASVPGTDPTVTPKVGTPFPYIGIVQAAGTDRYETAAIIAQGSFAPSPDSAVFITSGEAPADALTAGPAAATLEAPLLLTRADVLPEATASEIARLAPSTVYVVGGADRISDATLAVITAAATAADPTATVERIAGDDRYDTAVQVADQFFPDATGVVLTRGDTFPDALSGGAAAAAAGVPLMITEPEQTPDPVDDWLQENTFETALIVGGPTSVSEPVASVVAARTSDPTTVVRIAGADRYDTSAAVAAALFPDATTALIATGDNFPDALAGVPAAAVNFAPMLLLPKECTPVSLVTYVLEAQISSEIVLGGPSSVTPEALTTTCV